MNKPWNNEPTPTTKSLWDNDAGEYAMGGNTLANLERRMRAAERLLHWISEKPVSDIGAILKQTKIHLEAAKKEDNADYIGEDNPVCPSCKMPFDEHLGLVGTCRQLQEVTAELHNVYQKWDSDKYLLRGALRIIRDAGLNVGSTELIDAARKEDEE